MEKISNWNRFRIIWFTTGIVFSIWQWSTYQARDIDLSLTHKQEAIRMLEDESKISFIYDQSSELEVIFFPGGLVDPKSYIPLARRIAVAGYNIHIIKMPWRLATKGYNSIKEIFDLKDKEKVFILGGHSQGGKMAAQFVYENEDLISGLFLLGTSHPRDIDMSAIEIPCIKIYAENDGLASVEEVLHNADKLPKDTQLRLINGGNHSQFGFIGKLLMDGTATISKEEQSVEITNYLLEFIQTIRQTSVTQRLIES